MPEQTEGSLSEMELDQLSEFLSSVGSSAMSLEEFDGFLTALVVGPDIVLPSEYWPEVIGTDDVQIADRKRTQTVFGLVFRHWNHIARTLDATNAYEPILCEDDTEIATGARWGRGFMRGVHMRFDEWRRFIADDETAGLVLPITMLANQGKVDSKHRAPELTDDRRRQVLVSTAAALPKIYRHFQARREPIVEPFKRPEPKAGRNDPCPCGSGKKFKHCCGAAHTTH